MEEISGVNTNQPTLPHKNIERQLDLPTGESEFSCVSTGSISAFVPLRTQVKRQLTGPIIQFPTASEFAVRIQKSKCHSVNLKETATASLALMTAANTVFVQVTEKGNRTRCCISAPSTAKGLPICQSSLDLYLLLSCSRHSSEPLYCDQKRKPATSSRLPHRSGAD